MATIKNAHTIPYQWPYLIEKYTLYTMFMDGSSNGFMKNQWMEVGLEVSNMKKVGSGRR